MQNQLTKQFMRQSNMIKPTATDIRIARDRGDTTLQRAELEYPEELMRRQNAGDH